MTIKDFVLRPIRKLEARLSNLFGEEAPVRRGVQPVKLCRAAVSAGLKASRDFGSYASLPNLYEVSVSQEEWEDFFRDNKEGVADSIGQAVAAAADGRATHDGQGHRIGGDGVIRVSVVSDPSLNGKRFKVHARFGTEASVVEDVTPISAPDAASRPVAASQVVTTPDLTTETASPDETPRLPPQASTVSDVVPVTGTPFGKGTTLNRQPAVSSHDVRMRPDAVVVTSDRSSATARPASVAPVPVAASTAWIQLSDGSAQLVHTGDVVGVLRRSSEAKPDITLTGSSEDGSYQFSQAQCKLVLNDGEWQLVHLGRNATVVNFPDGTSESLSERSEAARLRNGCTVGVGDGDPAFTFRVAGGQDEGTRR